MFGRAAVVTASDTGVVAQHIQAAVVADGFGYALFDGGFVRHIQGAVLYLGASGQFAEGLFQTFGVTVDQHEFGAFAGQTFGGGAANTAAGTGDQGNLVIKTLHGSCPLLCCVVSECGGAALLVVNDRC